MSKPFHILSILCVLTTTVFSSEFYDEPSPIDTDKTPAVLEEKQPQEKEDTCKAEWGLRLEGDDEDWTEFNKANQKSS